jgi:hypothetical protein
MKAFIAALLVMVGSGFIGALILEGFQNTADSRYKTGGVRLDPSELERGTHPVAKPPAAVAPPTAAPEKK